MNRIRRWIVTAISKHISGEIRQLRERVTPSIEQHSNIRDTCGGRSLSKSLSCIEQPIERFAMIPVELIDRPSRDWRLRQRFYEIGVIRPPSLLKLCREFVSCAGELRQWE